jgi:hypothetical protein
MTGSIRSEIENELARREYERQLQERWQTILSGAAGYVRDYFRTYKPAAVVYDPNIRHRVANYENAVVELSFTARAVVFSKKEMPLFKMLKDLEAGLERAQKGKEWHIDFVQAVLGGNVYGYGDNSFTFTYTVEGVVLNAAGVEIHRFSTPLQTKIAALEVTRQTKNGARLRSSAIVFCEYPAEPKVLEQTVSFQTPLADVTDDMTIQITAVYESEGGENLIDEEKLIKVKILEGILSSQTPLAAEMADDMMRQITAESGENLIAVIPVMTEGKWALRAGFRAAKAPEYERFRIGVSVDGGVLYGSSYPDIDGDKEQPGGGHTHFSNYQAGLYARLGAEAGIRSLFAETGITFNPNNTSSGKLFYYNGHWGHGASSLLRGNPLVTLFEAGAGYRFFWQRKRQVDNQWFWGTGLNLSGGVAFMSAEDAPALVTTGMDSNVTTTTTTVEGYNGMALYLGVKLFNDTPRHYYPMNDISGFALNSTLRRMYMSLRLYIPLAAPEHTRVAWGFGWMFYPVRM